MNFWKNPEYAPLKTLLAFVLAVGIGWGIYNIAGNSGGLTGNILKGTKDKTENGISFDVEFQGKTCTINYCITGNKVSNVESDSSLCPPMCDNVEGNEDASISSGASNESNICPPMCDVTYTEQGACFITTGITKTIEGEQTCQVDEKLSDEVEEIITKYGGSEETQPSSSR